MTSQGGKVVTTCVILLCLVSATSCGAAIGMSMEMNSFDDQYVGCREEMLQKVLEPGGLLETELEADHDYLEAWKNGRTCMTPIPGASTEHNIAVATLTSDFNFYDKFSFAVWTQGGNVDIYMSSFPYKSLHFLVTDAMRLLNKTENCYQGISGSHTNFGLTETNTTVRLGHYVWGSPFMEAFCTTEYRIKSCLAVDIASFSCLKDLSVIIPPHEMFNVTAMEVFHDDDDNMVIRKVVISLTSIGSYKKHDCSFLAKSTPILSSAPSSFPQLLSYSLVVLLVTSFSLTKRH